MRAPPQPDRKRPPWPSRRRLNHTHGATNPGQEDHVKLLPDGLSTSPAYCQHTHPVKADAGPTMGAAHGGRQLRPPSSHSSDPASPRLHARGPITADHAKATIDRPHPCLHTPGRIRSTTTGRRMPASSPSPTEQPQAAPSKPAGPQASLRATHGHPRWKLGSAGASAPSPAPTLEERRPQSMPAPTPPYNPRRHNPHRPRAAQRRLAIQI